MKNISELASEPLVKRPNYVIDYIDTYQTNDGIYAEYIVTNNGNAPSRETDRFTLEFTGPYAIAQDYDKDTLIWLDQELSGIGAGESKCYTNKLSVISEAFNEYGYVDCKAEITDKDEKTMYIGDSVRIVPYTPVDLLLNDKEFPNEITVKVGEELPLKVTNASEIEYGDSIRFFMSDDEEVAYIGGENLVGVKEGNTTLRLYSVDYSEEIKELNVNVVSSGNRSGRSSSKKLATEQQQEAKTQITWENPFLDVKFSDWFYNDVKSIVLKGIMVGTKNNTFEPNLELTRGMFVTMLYRADGEPAFMNDNVFSDVEEDAYYEKAVVWASGKEIVKGITDTEFAPNKTITREEIATMLFRYAKFKGVDMEKEVEDINTLSYNDIFDVSDWASSAVHFCLATVIINGDENGNVMPKKNATRAETAAMLVRYLNKYTN